jgi:hypothetical protein
MSKQEAIEELELLERILEIDLRHFLEYCAKQ